jgi:hypothetical protein
MRRLVEPHALAQPHLLPDFVHERLAEPLLGQLPLQHLLLYRARHQHA